MRFEGRGKFFSSIAGGLLSVLSVQACKEEENKFQQIQKLDFERDIKQDEKKNLFQIEDVKKQTQERKKRTEEEIRNQAFQFIKEKRFANEYGLKTYFSVLKEKRFEKIKKVIEDVSKKTSVPNDVLFVVGFLETRFLENSKREDTEVFGNYQMTLQTAEHVKTDAQKIFHHSFKIDEENLMKDTVSTQLCAVRLKQLYDKYGDWEMVLSAYSSSESELESKISKYFQDVDFGRKDRLMMISAKQHILEAKEQWDLAIKKNELEQTLESKRDVQISYKKFLFWNQQYKKHETAWKEKTSKMKKIFETQNVNISELVDKIKQQNHPIPFSLTYGLSFDGMKKQIKKMLEKTAHKSGSY